MGKQTPWNRAPLDAELVVEVFALRKLRPRSSGRQGWQRAAGVPPADGMPPGKDGAESTQAAPAGKMPAARWGYAMRIVRPPSIIKVSPVM